MLRDAMKILPDYVLTVLASACFVVVVLAGFVVEEDLQFNYALNLALCALLQFLLFACAVFRGKAVLLGGLYVLACLAFLGLGLNMSTVDVLLDEEGNRFIYALVVVLTNTGVYLLSRTRVRFVFLLAGGILTVGYIQFVYHANLYAPSLLSVLCCTCLFMYRNYCRNAEGSDLKGRFSPVSALAAQAAIVGLALALSLAIFFVAIAPLNPPRLTLKLFTMDEALETIEVNNPVIKLKVEDEEQLTETVTDEEIYGNRQRQVDATDVAGISAQDFLEDSLDYSGASLTYDVEGEDTADLDLTTYELPSWWWLLIPAGAVFLICAAVAIRLFLRRHRRAKIMKMPLRAQIASLYTASLARLEKVGIKKPMPSAPCEFAEAGSERLGEFTRGDTRADWGAVSLAYDITHYGGYEPSTQQLSSCWSFYDSFCSCAAVFVGRRRYCFKYFWIL